MPTPITETTVSFTYDIADAMYASTNNDGRTGSGSYTGPDRVWVFVDSETNKFSQVQQPLTSMEDGADVPTPIGHRKVEVVAADTPAIIASIMEQFGYVTYDDESQVTETLPDGSICRYNTTASLSQTYNKDGLTHDGSAWTWPAFEQAPLTWDDVIEARNGALIASDGRISPDMPDDVKAPWIAYRTALRNLPVTFKRGEADEIEAWKVEMPTHPEDGE